MTSCIPPISELEAFTAVAELASFTLAARRLCTSKSSVGRAVRQLEERLGVILLQRSTRAVHLTEEGKAYLVAVRGALGTLIEAGRDISAHHGDLAGHLRVDLPAGLGRVIVPTLSEFTERYPEITLEIGLNDKFSNVISEGWDLVVRVGELDDSSLVARKLCNLRFGLYASPAYLSRRGAVGQLDDLIGHDFIVFRSPNGLLKPWLLNKNGSIVEIIPSPRIVFSDSRALIEAVISDLGIALCFNVTATAAVAAGRAVQVLPETETAGPPVAALLPHGLSRMPAKTRAFVDHLARVLGPFGSRSDHAAQMQPGLRDAACGSGPGAG